MYKIKWLVQYLCILKYILSQLRSGLSSLSVTFDKCHCVMRSGISWNGWVLRYKEIQEKRVKISCSLPGTPVLHTPWCTYPDALEASLVSQSTLKPSCLLHSRCLTSIVFSLLFCSCVRHCPWIHSYKTLETMWHIVNSQQIWYYYWWWSYWASPDPWQFLTVRWTE